MVLRLVWWYSALPQAGQQRNSRSEESAAGTSSFFGSGNASAVAKALLSSATPGAFAGSFPSCDESRDFP
jgi:hypothetical protein